MEISVAVTEGRISELTLQMNLDALIGGSNRIHLPLVDESEVCLAKSQASSKVKQVPG